MGDFNITMVDRDSTIINVTQNEINARRITKVLMFDTNLKDCYRGEWAIARTKVDRYQVPVNEVIGK